jgi:hypothetical protein
MNLLLSLLIVEALTGTPIFMSDELTTKARMAKTKISKSIFVYHSLNMKRPACLGESPKFEGTVGRYLLFHKSPPV